MIISFLISYLLGSIPFGKIVTKVLTGKDITKTGSQNIGATNVYRSVSKKAGLLVLILELLFLFKFGVINAFETLILSQDGQFRSFLFFSLFAK